jgi:hypothetical protein
MRPGRLMVHVVSLAGSGRAEDREYVGLGSTVLDRRLRLGLASRDNVLVSIKTYSAGLYLLASNSHFGKLT